MKTLSSPETLGRVDLIHGILDLVVRLNVCDKRLDDHETKCSHALCQLLLDCHCNLHSRPRLTLLISIMYESQTSKVLELG